ncbi:hypothetical protein V8F20_008774 [Naviculisporaceae sp. PSN 640]
MADRPPNSEERLTLLGERPSKKDGGVDQDSEASRLENSEPHNLMLLYDLFFAANMTAFSGIQDTTTTERLVAYIGYFSVLWFLWLNVMLFDVRFVADSILERILRAIHLGAMVGVSVVAPQYDPSNQIKETFQTFSIILMISRLTLAAQYGIAMYLRRDDSEAGIGYFCKQALDKKTKRTGLIIMAATHIAAALIYLGITFRFTNSKNSRVFTAWYIVGIVEACIIFGVSYWFEELRFKGKGLQDRMKTATLLILGEGVIVVADEISKVVKNANSWTPQTVGVLTATVALIYIIFQIYFDWAWPPEIINKRRNPPSDSDHQEEKSPAKTALYLWTLAHFPFHLALVLVMEGATQFVVWWKIVELIDYVSDRFLSAFRLAEADTRTNIADSMVLHLNTTVNEIWEQYPRDLLVSHFHREELLKIIGDFKDSALRGFSTPDGLEGNAEFQNFTDAFRALKVTTLNSILKNYGIEEIEDAGWQDHPETYEQHAFDDAAKRFNMVYIYVFCLAGAAMILMGLLHVLCRPRLDSAMQRLVLGIVIVSGVGLMMLASMANFEAHTRFTTTPWIIPSICIVFLFALFAIHGSRWITSSTVVSKDPESTAVESKDPESRVETKNGQVETKAVTESPAQSEVEAGRGD